MKKILLTLLLLGGCADISPREQCYAKNYCDSAVGDCILGWTFIAGSLGGSNTISSTDSYHSYTQDEREGNNTWSSSDTLYIYGAGNETSMVGSIGSDSDVDLFYFSNNTYEAMDLKITRVAGDAQCALYTGLYTKYSASLTGSNIDLLTSRGNAPSSGSNEILLPVGDKLYMKCTGSSADTYKVKFTNPQKEIEPVRDPDSSTGVTVSSGIGFQGLGTLMCVTAKDDCISLCDEKHVF